MRGIRGRLEGGLSVDWSKRAANLVGLACAMAVYLVWAFLPFPRVHYVVYNVDLAGALLTACACAASAAFAFGRDGRRAGGALVTYLIYALLVATLLIFASLALDVRLILVPSGVNLDVVVLLVSLVAFLGVVGKRGFWGLFLGLFFLVGIPLLLVDFYFGLAISVTARIPYETLVVGGGGLGDGLNKMFFMLLAFAGAYYLLMANREKEMEALGVRIFGAPEVGSGGVPAPEPPPDAPQGA